jgi:hypothetical protein
MLARAPARGAKALWAPTRVAHASDTAATFTEISVRHELGRTRLGRLERGDAVATSPR